MEEALKMRNLLQEFHRCQGRRPPTVLGLREHIFTGRLDPLFPSTEMYDAYACYRILLTSLVANMKMLETDFAGNSVSENYNNHIHLVIFRL